jgi:hypothetical protein
MRRNNIVTCDTRLPDGSPVGNHIKALVDGINRRAKAEVPPAPTNYGPIWPLTDRADPRSVVQDVYRGTNFRGMFGRRGRQGRLHDPDGQLGDAGNFAYFAVARRIGIPLSIAQAAAGAYAAKHHKDRPGPFGMDASATNQWRAGWNARCEQSPNLWRR